MATDKTYRLRVAFSEVVSDSLIVGEAKVSPFIKPVVTKKERNVLLHRPPTRLYTSLPEHDLPNPLDGSVIVLPGEGRVMIGSVVQRPTEGQKTVKTWTVLTKYGLTVQQANSGYASQVNKQWDSVTNTLKVALLDGYEWGCLQLRCMADTLHYGDRKFSKDEILDFYFHRDHDGASSIPYPPMVNLFQFSDQNYIPLVPGQILQVLPSIESQIDDLQEMGDRCVMWSGQDRVGKSNNWRCFRYECVQIPQRSQHLYIKGKENYCVIFPPIYRSGKEVFVVVTEPCRCVRVDCSNINSLRVRFAHNIPKVQCPNNYMEIPYADTSINELKVAFKKTLRYVVIQYENNQVEFRCAAR